MCFTLVIVFVALKLFKVVDWPWVWVLAPIWLPYAIVAVLTGLAILSPF